MKEDLADEEGGAAGDPGRPIPHEQEVANSHIELYKKVSEVAELHPESNVNVENIEASEGLSSVEALKRLAIHGKNILTPPKKVPEWKKLLMQYTSLFLVLLIASALLSIIAYILLGNITNLYLAIVLLVVVFLTGLVQYHEEGKAYKIIDSFKTMLATNCLVLRDGRQQTIDTADLVPGDLVIIKNGDKVPADVVLILCRGLKTECSSLTGESEPISCTDQPSPEGTRMFECKNIAFNGSLCFDGMAIGLVLTTGDKSAIGTIAKLASDTKLREATLQIEVRNFVKLVGVIAVSLATVCFITSIILQKARTADQIVKLFINGFLVIMVANIPQGLPSTVVSLLSLAARNMARQSVLVKRIDCVETLGSCSIICSDKTGTLTKNEMTVTEVWYNQKFSRRQKWEAKSLYSQEPQALLYRAAMLCNRAEPVSADDVTSQAESRREALRQRVSNVSKLSWGNSVPNLDQAMEDEQHETKFSGNPSDAALLKYCDRMHSVSSLRRDCPILFEVPFNSTNKWQLVIVENMGDVSETESDTEYEVLMKGAPEVILGRCSTYATHKGDSHHHAAITDEFKKEFNSAYESFASKGKRVLALCSTTFRAPAHFEFEAHDDGSYNFPTSSLTFIGLVAIMDPPRDNVPHAIAKCHEAGVKVFMVTGDHPLTGSAIARQIGLLQSDNNIILLEDETSTIDWETCDGAIIHGCRIDELSDEQWRIILSKSGGVCFARTTPAHKLLIVEKCQTLMGQIVAVTGDGVNDAPALKQADIGVAMGLNGSAVAQEAADILLMDDNFASIVSGIEEGRIIFDNLKKTIAYTVAHTLPEVWSGVLALVTYLPAGMPAMLVLTIDLGTELGPAISLAFEKPESNIMKRKPRHPLKDRLVSPVLLFYSYVTAGTIISIGCLVAYILTYRQHNVLMSDFYRPGLIELGGNGFSLFSSEPVTIERTGQTFTPEEQRHIFSQAATAWYITVTVTQFCHIWLCKTRINSIFEHGFKNRTTFYGVAIGFFLSMFFSYVPGVHNFVGSAAVGWVPWACVPVTASVLFIYNEGSKWYFRRAKPDDWFVRMFSW